MSALILYRVEHAATGLGPYVGWDLYGDDDPQLLETVQMLRTTPNALGNRPQPAPDMMLHGTLAALNEVQHGTAWAHWFHYDTDGPAPERERHDWACAFASHEQLTRWFDPSEQALLAAVGFEVVELELIEGAAFAHGRAQSVYRTAEVARRTPQVWPALEGACAA